MSDGGLVEGEERTKIRYLVLVWVEVSNINVCAIVPILV